jgi:ketosteroid isomerase-like protein
MLVRSLFFAALCSLLGACSADSRQNNDAAVIAAAKAGYDAFATGDMEAWAATQAPDAQWEMPKGFPYGGGYVGPQQVIDGVFTPIGELWPDFKVEPTAFHAAGNVVFIETKMTAGGVVSDSIHKAVIENGKYAAFQVYDDAGFMMAHSTAGASIGEQYFGDGSSKPLLAGSGANAQLWVDYIQAHNERDFDTIASMNAEDFKGVTAGGEVVRGSEAQAAFLHDWVAAENPQWAVWWVIPNDGENEEGGIEEWLATGNIITATGLDGTERTVYETIDVLIEDGKIRLLNVASQTMPQ